ncbi:5-deoxy-glucuronate isomerase [Pseudoruegeria sp. SHC-113]|uniref:5-deoxy-glucuronate isomerase n=1 Tax=Pseudoruegeria sp. SHC-113 TaxID=2855439 RepID=UPI0021BAEA1B|nr:5-deoxy-glucuronate isomerase [Pseudoruegeria sp. SHC-113]MCT8160190.1 5-deoxy-glucuronate isomerase [Pseudoruegeria sp. SHC-113]
MADLLRKPLGQTGRTHAITPEAAGWGYVGFDLWRLAAGEEASGQLDGREAILVLVEGRAQLTADGQDFGEMGERMDVFERLAPHCLYVPAGADWAATATTGCTLAVCSAPAKPGRAAQVLGPAGITLETRGEGANTRYINNIAMEGRDVAESLLVTEVFTPAGNWSSYPPHRHDEDDFPRITYLEETYYHRLNPPDCFGVQRVFTDDLSLDETMAVSDQDVVLVPRGHHPCAAPYGVEMYYLNVMAGPRRNWRFQMHPAFAHMG